MSGLEVCRVCFQRHLFLLVTGYYKSFGNGNAMCMPTDEERERGGGMGNVVMVVMEREKGSNGRREEQARAQKKVDRLDRGSCFGES